MEEKLVYVTGNYQKYMGVAERFLRAGVSLDFVKADFEELEINDIYEIAKDKVTKAYQLVGKPCFAADTGFFIDHYPEHPGYPGAFAKRSGVSMHIEELLEAMKEVEDRSCRFVDCLVFYDGSEYYTFWGLDEGRLATTIRGEVKKEAKSRLWQVFIRNGWDKTLSEMTLEERSFSGDHKSATESFLKWYKTEYQKEEDFQKRK